MKEIQIQFKSETGLSAFDEIEVDQMNEPLYWEVLQENTKGEIISMIRYDNDNNLKDCIVLEKTNIVIDQRWKEVKIYKPEYVEWLESKISKP